MTIKGKKKTREDKWAGPYLSMLEKAHCYLENI